MREVMIALFLLLILLSPVYAETPQEAPKPDNLKEGAVSTATSLGKAWESPGIETLAKRAAGIDKILFETPKEKKVGNLVFYGQLERPKFPHSISSMTFSDISLGGKVGMKLPYLELYTDYNVLSPTNFIAGIKIDLSSLVFRKN